MIGQQGKARLLLWAALASPSLDDLTKSFERFKAMSNDARSEEQRVTAYLRKDPALPAVTSTRRIASLGGINRLSPAQQVEWSLRLADQAPMKSLESLKGIGDIVLLDEGMWAYFRTDIPNVYSDFLRWRAERDRFARFIASLEEGQRRALFQQRHGDWWKWFAGEDIDSIQDPQVIALNLVINAASAGQESRVRMLVEARSYLFGRPGLEKELHDFEARALELLVRDHGESAVLTNALFLADVGDYRLQKQEFLRTLVDYFKRRNRPELAADALEKLQSMERVFEKTDASDYLQLADLQFAGKQYALAAESYHRALLRSRELWVEAEARSGLAFSSEKLAENAKGAERDRLFEWAAEHYRQACESGLVSKSRDELLEGYARTLDRLGYWEAAVDVSEALFKVGAKREGQIHGLEQMSRILSEHIAGHLKKKSPDMFVREKYQRFVHSISLLAQADSHNPKLSPWLAQAQGWVVPLDYKGDMALAATLTEISQKISRGSLKR